MESSHRGAVLSAVAAYFHSAGKCGQTQACADDGDRRSMGLPGIGGTGVPCEAGICLRGAGYAHRPSPVGLLASDRSISTLDVAAVASYLRQTVDNVGHA